MYEGMPVQLADEDNDDNLEVCSLQIPYACRDVVKNILELNIAVIFFY